MIGVGEQKLRKVIQDNYSWREQGRLANLGPESIVLPLLVLLEYHGIHLL